MDSILFDCPAHIRLLLISCDKAVVGGDFKFFASPSASPPRPIRCRAAVRSFED